MKTRKLGRGGLEVSAIERVFGSIVVQGARLPEAMLALSNQ